VDAGCGSGRDAAAFAARGYRVVATEPCEALARRAEALLGAPWSGSGSVRCGARRSSTGCGRAPRYCTCHDATCPGPWPRACGRSGPAGSCSPRSARPRRARVGPAGRSVGVSEPPAIPGASWLEGLETGPLHRFADWPVAVVPRSACGRLHGLGRRGRLCTSAWRARRAALPGSAGTVRQAGQPRRRAAQRRPVCVYVCDRLVLPGLHGRLAGLADGFLSLDRETRRTSGRASASGSCLCRTGRPRRPSSARRGTAACGRGLYQRA
jgi:hypothetical protein